MSEPIESAPSHEVALAEPSLADYADQGFDANVIPLERLGDIIVAGQMLSKFVKAVEARALDAMEHGARIPGLKLVRGRSVRRVQDPDGTLTGELVAKGLIDAMQPKTITNLASILKRAVHDGVVDADFKAHVEADYVTRQPGNIAVVPVSDPRAELPVDPVTGMVILAEPQAEPGAKAKATGKRKAMVTATPAADGAVTNVAKANAAVNAAKAAEEVAAKAEPKAEPKTSIDGVDVDALFGLAAPVPAAEPSPASAGPSVTGVGADLDIDIEALLG